MGDITRCHVSCRVCVSEFGGVDGAPSFSGSPFISSHGPHLDPAVTAPSQAVHLSTDWAGAGGQPPPMLSVSERKSDYKTALSQFSRCFEMDMRN